MAKDSSTFLFTKIKKAAHAVKEWDKNLAYKIQGKFELSNYQMLCLSCAKGFIIAAIIL
tara:strand:+ start:722 stop:898 length:177 start_codon:yes stop_codon:yes gene_type:complete